jgi:alpha-N-acetylgalactosaminidase
MCLGRPMVYICEWPLYQKGANYSAVADTCHVYRNAGDIGQTWQSVQSIINFYGDNNDLFSKYSGQCLSIIFIYLIFTIFS